MISKLSLVVLLVGVVAFRTQAQVELSVLQTQKDDSFVQLKTGEKLYGKVEFKKPFLALSHILFNDTVRYELERVQSFQNSDGYFGKVAGTKSSMVRRIEKGNIDLYQETKSSWSPGHTYSFSTPMGVQTHSTMGSFNAYSAEYFSKDGGDILDADYANLKNALSDNPKSMKHLNTYRALGYVEWGVAGTGVALIIGGLATSTKEEFNKSLVVTGAVVALAAWIPHVIRGGELESAIRVYNKK